MQHGLLRVIQWSELSHCGPLSYWWQNSTAKLSAFYLFHSRCSKDSGTSMVHGATDLQDNHSQQVQEETGAAHGLPEDVSSGDVYFFPASDYSDDTYALKTLISYSIAECKLAVTGLELWRTWMMSSCLKSLTPWRRCVPKYSESY